ncbi:hypothetical protein AMS68_005311 [Peltaster fructicola]|uniref:Rab-GAP TBC domain-containing protein n=1 Tax=Peltaster fructicola TaxID=286661 RepID=A0A6H0XYH5_9PEZI|nr:hypothetical protein AMS68_005311 [Peltaster fructicola]
MSTFVDNATSALAQRQRTTHASDAVKSVLYDQASPGVPPKAAVAALREETMSNPQERTPRPRTAPAQRRTSQLSDDVKRDSGFAGSTKSQLSPTLPPTPNLPAFVLAGDPNKQIALPTVQETARRPRTSLGRRRSKKASKQKTRSVSPPNFKRLSSFRGLETDIPTGGLEDLDVTNFGFSHRGSIFFGKDMDNWFGPASKSTLEPSTVSMANKTAAEPGTTLLPSRSTTELTTTTAAASNGTLKPPTMPVPISSAGHANDRAVPAVEIPTISEPVPPAVEPTPMAEGDKENIPETPTRLKAGRRKPSLQMLQAAIAGGRVLSADEINFSMKVRSMYEAGDEDGADWSVQSGKDSSDTPTSHRNDDSPQDQLEDLPIRKSRQAGASKPGRMSQDIRASYHTKAEHELAGGIEDWQDIDGGDVDRYGFIVPRSEPDRPGSGANAAGLHRVATGLRLAADQPRRRGLRRTPSTARSSRSVPPQASIRPSSLHSAVSASPSVRSRRSTFRGRDRRITDAAGDMLTLPPGLADIAENQDDGQAINLLRRREWARNEKWQKMARPLKDSTQGTGGGMLFDFDVNDPKVISRTWKGIPDRWRATAWHSFLSASARRRGNYDNDKHLIQQFWQLQDTNCADDYQIDVDVPRTISMHVMFRRRYRGGQRLLFRVLHAIALYFPEIGYVQGMASLAATLLCYFDEERAFVMMVRLWQLRGLEQLFQPGFNGLMAALKELEDQWLAGSDMARKLNNLAIASTSYGTRWYLTLFNMSVPFPAQLRVWDVFMLLGDAVPINSGSFGGADLDVLHATSTALIDATREIIIDSDFENAMKVLTSFVPIRDEDLLMRVARVEYKIGKKRNGNKGTTA